MKKQILLPGSAANAAAHHTTGGEMQMLMQSILAINDQIQTVTSMMHLDSLGKCFGTLAYMKAQGDHNIFRAEMTRMCDKLHPTGCTGAQSSILKYVDNIVCAHGEVIFAAASDAGDTAVATKLVEDAVKEYLEFIQRLREQETAAMEGKAMAGASKLIS